MKKTHQAQTIIIPDGEDCLFPTNGLKAHWLRPAKPARSGVVVVPIQGGDYDVSIMLAKFLTKCGHHTLRFERRADWLDASKDPAELVPHVRQYLRDIPRGIDMWLDEGEVAPDRIGLMGVSMGAIMGSGVLAADPRIKASVLVIGGAELGDILTNANDEEINLYRKDLAKRLGLTEQDLVPKYKELLAPLTELDPTGKVDSESILYMSARFDQVVRYPHATLLWERLGRPKRWTLPCGHYSTVVFLPLIKWLTRRWFGTRL